VPYLSTLALYKSTLQTDILRTEATLHYAAWLQPVFGCIYDRHWVCRRSTRQASCWPISCCVQSHWEDMMLLYPWNTCYASTLPCIMVSPRMTRSLRTESLT